jgi:hypothetical protein
MRAHDALLDDMDKRKYVYVDLAFVDYLDTQALYGPVVWKKFPRARRDITEAGNCLALGSSTAAVFHAMRVAEHGLRALAKKLGAKTKHTGAVQPIEYADWDTVITAIKNRIASLRPLSRGPIKTRNLEFYSDMAEQCEYMKDIWRNTISHTRRPYNVGEAVGVLKRVEDLMKRLATDLRRMR